MDVGNLQQPTEAPGGAALLRAQTAELLLLELRQLRKLPAAHRLHDPDGNIVLCQQLALGLGILQRPVQIVELDLAEFHMLPVSIQELLQILRRAVAGKAQMLNSAQSFLFNKIVNDSPAGISIGGVGILADIVQQVEVKILHAAFFQLLGKDCRRIIAVADLMAGILGGKIIAVPGELVQDLPDNHLGHAAVIGIGGVKIIDALLQRIAHHFLRPCLVDASVSPGRQTHGAEAETRELLSLKFTIDHVSFSPP